MKKKYIAPLFFAICLIGSIWYALYSHYKEINVLKKDGVYTICTLTDVEGLTGGREITVEYSINGKKYMQKGQDNCFYRSDIGTRYFIKVPLHEPDSYFDIPVYSPVPDSIKEAPPQGWKTPPIPLVQSKDYRERLLGY